MKSTLRPHQADAIARLRQSLGAGKRRPVVQAPTGFGKTVIAAAIVEMALAKGNRVVFCAPAITLIDQTVQRFYDEGIVDVGVIQADHPMTDASKPVQVASVQTIGRRDRPKADLVIVDECHRMFRTLNEWMADPAWERVPFVGLSATPWTRGLGKVFDDLIIASTTKELIVAGYLSPFKVFAPAHPDLSGVKTVAGDFHEGQLGETMNKPALVADVVSTWARLGEDRPTLAFAVDRAHAQAIQKDFCDAGVSCEYIDAFTPQTERDLIRQRLERGDVKVVSSVGCLTTGVDWDVRCIIMARPTRSEMLFVQMIGRGLRTANGKNDLIVLDHADNHTRLGFVTDIHRDALDVGAMRKKSETERERKASLPKECSHCTFLMPVGTNKCPSCGTPRTLTAEVELLEGELAEMAAAGKRGRAAVNDYMPAQKQIWYGSLLGIAADRGYKKGWAANQYREKMGVWPRGLTETPLRPATEVLRWVQSRQIAWAKRRKGAAGGHAGA